MSSMVWFANLWSVRPVYHGWPVGPDYTERTYCGRKMWDRESGGLGTLMRSDHAQRIGRACRRCW